MTKAELEKLAKQYQQKADKAYYTYQETGVTRYDTVRRKNEDMAEALRMAAAAKDQQEAGMKDIVNELLSLARLSGLLQTENRR